MKTVHDILRERLLEKAGLIPVKAPKPKWTLAELEQEWSPEFERYMRNRLMMGALRYGPLRRKTGLGFDGVTSAIKRLCIYRETGNLECLIDVANLCLVAFCLDDHSKKHFDAIDDGVHAVKV